MPLLSPLHIRIAESCFHPAVDRHGGLAGAARGSIQKKDVLIRAYLFTELLPHRFGLCPTVISEGDISLVGSDLPMSYPMYPQGYLCPHCSSFLHEKQVLLQPSLPRE